MAARYDVAIIGAGPAGATLARMLGPVCRVLLVERRRLWSGVQEGVPAKVCGGLLAPDAQEALATLGLGLPKDLLVDPQLFVVRTLDCQEGLERFYQRFYLNMDRGRFDRWLASLVPDTVDVQEGTSLKGVEEGPRALRLTLIRGGRHATAEARILIGADGAASAVRRLCGLAPGAIPRYVSVQEHFEARGPEPYFSAIFDRGLTDFYCWTIPKGGALLVGGAYHPGRRAGEAHRALKGKLAGHGYQWGRRIRREGAVILRPLRSGHLCLGRGRVGLVGEAAGWISPSSAEGLSYGFRSARYLAESIGRDPERFLEAYHRASAPLRRNIVLKNLKAVFMYHPLLRSMILRSGVRATEPPMVAEAAAAVPTSGVVPSGVMPPGPAADDL